MQKTTPGGYWIEEVQQIYLFVNSIAICQKSLKPSYWEVMDPSVLPEYAHLAGSITSLQLLYFRVKRFILLVQMKKSNFYELQLQHKQLKIMEMSKGHLWRGYIHQLQPEPTHWEQQKQYI